MRRRLWLVFALAGLVEGGVALWLVLTSNHETQPLLTSVLGLVLGWSFILSGTVATLRRPENRTGLLLALVGFVWFLGAFSDSNNSVGYTFGIVVESAAIASFVHLLLAYPRGTLDSRLERRVVAAGYAVTLLGPMLYLLFREQPSACAECPPNGLFISDRPLAADIVNIAVDIVGVAVLGLAVLVLVRRWRSASTAYRRSLRSVLSAGALTLICFLLALAADPVSHTLGVAFSIGAGLGVIAVPFFFLMGLLRSRFAAGAMGRLVVELGRTPEPWALRDAFRSALHDPTLQLAYWLPEAQAYVDAEGRFFEPPEGRSTTIVNDDEGPIATLVHDPSLDDEPELVQSAVAAARLAILNERFQAELRARVNELEQERDFTRLVVDSTPALFCVIDPDGRIVRFNRSLEVLSGHPDNDAARGRFFWELFSTPERADEDRAALAAAAAGVGAATKRRQSLLPSPDGDRLVEWLDVRFADEQGQLRFLLEAGLDVTEREQNLADVRSLAEEQAALRRVAEVVASGRSEEVLMASVIEEAALLLGAQSAHMVSYEADEMIRLMGRWNAPGAESAPMGGLHPLDSHTVVWNVRETGGTVRVDDYDDIPGTLAELLRSIGIRSSVGAPITVNGRLWGAMTASRTTGEPFEEGAEERLGRFAALAAQAIENAQSRDEITNLAAEQAALRRVATVVASEPSEAELMAVVTEEAGKLLGAHTANLIRYEGADSLTVRGRWNDPSGLPADPLRMMTLDGQTILSRVRDAGAPVRLDTYEGIPGELAEFLRELGIKAAVAAPITVEGRLWGAMTASRMTEEAFAPGAEERLGRFADLAAQAIVNAQARREITSLAAEQTALRRVATLVASSPPQEVLFAAVSAEVAGLFGGETANVVRCEDDTFRVLGGWAVAGAEPVVPGTVFPLRGDGAVHRAMTSGSPARVDSRDELSDANLRAVWDELGICAAIAAPVQVEGSIWGGVAVFRTVDEPFAPGTEERLGDFGALVAQAIANAEAQAQLAASRARIVQATDEARRKLERNLHDGAQQRLVSLSLSLRLAQAKLESDPKDADAILSAASTELAHALEELRELARGIHPAVLSDRGLGPALQTLAQRSILPVEIDNAVEERLPGAVEAAAYYVVSESLANVAKYAQASSVHVRISRDNGVARVEVADDGIGGADPTQGSGLRGLADRVEALAGRFEVTSTSGAGTVIRAEIPVGTE